LRQLPSPKSQIRNPKQIQNPKSKCPKPRGRKHAEPVGSWRLFRAFDIRNLGFVSDVEVLGLSVEDGGDGAHSDWGIWISPQVKQNAETRDR
jgi:hypothetical protein